MKTASSLRPRLRTEIEAITGKILKELGNPPPPLKLQDVRELVKLDLSYFSTERDGLFLSTFSKLKRAGKQLLARPSLLGDAIRKFDLKALYLPDQRRVLIDDSVPLPKHRWLEAHEIGHDILPWHGQMLMGDDESTVSITAHAQIEAEANFAAGSLLFMGDLFREECKALSQPSIAHAKSLQKRFGNTLTTTVWRMVEYAGEERPMLAFVGDLPSAAQLKSTPCFRHFIPSPAFTTRFPTPDLPILEREIRRYCGWKTRGPLGSATLRLQCLGGRNHEFHFETFYNGYDALTLAVWLREIPVQIVVG